MRHDEGTEARVMARQGTIHRVTGETDVKVRLDLDGSGQCQASTGVPFLDHMLHQISSHGLIDLEINAVGDTHIDDHHTNEDVGIAVGQALAQAEEDGQLLLEGGGREAARAEEALGAARCLHMSSSVFHSSSIACHAGERRRGEK